MNRRILLFLALLLLGTGFQSFGQQPDNPVHLKHHMNENYQARRLADKELRTSATCTPDSNKYVFYKGQSFNVWSAEGTTGFSQYYGTGTGFTVKGVNLYIALDTTAGATIPVTVKLTSANANHTPTTTVLATASLNLNNSGIAGGTVEGYKKYVSFSSPVAITGNYCVLVEWTGSTNPVVFVSNDNGLQEDLAGLKVNNNWAPWYGTYGYDYDILLCPVTVMSYNDATFTVSPPCISQSNSTVALDITYPSIMDNKYYSMPAFQGFANGSHTWYYGDGYSSTDGDHSYTYGGSGPYTITLQDTLYGWTRNCASPAVTATVATTPSATFTYNINQGQVSFTGPVLNPTGTYAWDFGDGGTSTAQNPVHNFASIGTFTVCLTVTNSCGSQNYCENISISSVGIADRTETSIQVAPNPGNGEFKLTVSADMQQAEVMIYDVLGKQIQGKSIGQVNAMQPVVLDLHGYNPGIYFVTLRTEEGSWSQKIVLE